MSDQYLPSHVINAAHTVAHKITADGVAVVAPSCHWIPIDKNTPTGKAMWLINKAANSAQKGVYLPGEKFFDHWFPFPTFKKENK